VSCRAAIRVRPATAGDAAFIERIHKAAIRGISRRIHPAAELESWAAGLQPDFYRRAMDQNGERFLLAETAAGRVAGFSAYGQDEIYALYVDPALAGRGIGALLFARAEVALIAAGQSRIRIDASLAALPF
jgi:ribosomal protein S18 acetylase RimI-like enzyme